MCFIYSSVKAVNAVNSPLSMDSEDEYEESAPFRGVPATIILINVFGPSSKTAQVAHAATCSMVRQYLRESTSQCVSVCLFGIEDADDFSKLGAKGVVDVFPLTPPTLDDFKKLQEVNVTNLKQAKELIMSDALLHCSKMFANCKKLLSTRTIIILSKLDNPPIQADQKPALKRVEDLVDSNVDLKLINIAEQDYEIEEFYKDFILEANKGRDVPLPTSIWDEKEIEKLIHQHSHRHLAVARLNFEIGDGLNIGIGVYSLIKSQGQARHKSSYLERETNTVLTSVNKTVKVSMKAEDESAMDVDQDEDAQPSNQMLLHKSEILYSQQYGGERIEFTADEMKAIKNPFGPPMLKLLGFKPASLLCKEKWYLKRSYFLFPNDGSIEGSIVAFKGLHQACVETGMVAICVLCTRVNSRPINIALAPCTHPLGLDIDTGFDVITIPFVENVRDIPSFEEADEMDISFGQAVMKETVEKIKFSYKSEIFENPKLQSEYRAIEAIAFDDIEVEPFVDTTKQNAEKFKGINDELFYRVFGPFSVGPVKRPTSSNNGSTGPSKRIKTTIDETLLQSRIENGLIGRYTVADLRNILLSKDIPKLPAFSGLRKTDLIKLVLQHFK